MGWIQHLHCAEQFVLFRTICNSCYLDKETRVHARIDQNLTSATGYAIVEAIGNSNSRAYDESRFKPVDSRIASEDNSTQRINKSVLGRRNTDHRNM